VVVFAGSVRDNITLGRAVDDATVWKCVEAVSARGIVERLGGLDGSLDEGGRTLSTGERQLLSFARALVGNPPVLILDEATANVDTSTEMVIQEALRNLTRGRTSALAGSLVHKHLDARVPRCRTNDVALEYVLGSTETVSECSLFGRVARAVGGHILGLVDLLEERILGGEGSFLRLLHLL
jgi:ABC-type Mn2+/Zn2+ transport system ATPase subunit